MSCGKPHETPCTEVLNLVYGYLDGELGELDCARIRQHLAECGPCLREYDLDEAVKRLVARHCGCAPAPAALRAKIMVRIAEVRASIEFAELPPKLQLHLQWAYLRPAMPIMFTMRFGPARTVAVTLSLALDDNR